MAGRACAITDSEVLHLIAPITPDRAALAAAGGLMGEAPPE